MVAAKARGTYPPAWVFFIGTSLEVIKKDIKKNAVGLIIPGTVRRVPIQTIANKKGYRRGYKFAKEEVQQQVARRGAGSFPLIKL